MGDWENVLVRVLEEIFRGEFVDKGWIIKLWV